MVKLIIDDVEVEVEPGTSILNACGELDKEIPVFCYHPRLKVAGNCRMCLVEVEKSSKPVASCATAVYEGMVVRTKTPMVEKARKGVLELLLINHPLDCPICDQGGECDLQDITLNYGSDNSRYDFSKRAVHDKYMGPFIKTVMNRCIHCTRCVRFATDVAGVQEIGTSGRGENTEIISYLGKAISSELSGNMIDICPVGALTNKPYAFHGRPWELRGIDSIDVLDAVGSNIRIDVRDQQVMRIMPRLNETINEEWISDKTRFSYDGLACQRLDKPYIRKDGKLTACSWEEAITTVCQKIVETKPHEMAALAGDLADQESMLALRMLLDSVGVNNRDCRVDGAMLPYEHRSHYLFNSTIKNIEEADAVLLIGCNPRYEATMVNARLHKAAINNHCKIALIGKPADLTYPYMHLGDTPSALDELIRGSHPFLDILRNAKKPIVILGTSCFMPNQLGMLNLVNRLFKEYACQVNILHTAAARVSGLDVGFVPKETGKNFNQIIDNARNGSLKLLYLLNADIDESYGDAFVIYQGHHGDIGASSADVILPGSAFSEKNSTYVNMEGVAQQTKQALMPPGEAKEDWKIIRALSEKLGKSLPFNTLAQLQNLLPQLAKPDFEPFNVVDAKLSHEPFKTAVVNYYMHDVISRHSVNMANAISEIVGGNCGVV
ncbi:MAG: NADH-quinone oxidoreductase subunit NuoG [Proteobacteria bacterium]|nr:NADH-quinone oxidoreductase subunit NuoG [Pseudomonadota bacterium]